MKRRSELSECELITMKCIWDAKKPVTCQKVREQEREELKRMIDELGK